MSPVCVDVREANQQHTGARQRMTISTRWSLMLLSPCRGWKGIDCPCPWVCLTAVPVPLPQHSCPWQAHAGSMACSAALPLSPGSEQAQPSRAQPRFPSREQPRSTAGAARAFPAAGSGSCGGSDQGRLRGHTEEQRLSPAAEEDRGQQNHCAESSSWEKRQPRVKSFPSVPARASFIPGCSFAGEKFECLGSDAFHEKF